MHRLHRLSMLLAALLLACAAVPATAQPATPAASEQVAPAPDDGAAVSQAAPPAVDDHAAPPVWLVLPFVALLLMIATGPLFYPDFWHHHYPKVAVGLGLLVAAYDLFVLGDGASVHHALAEYGSFIALLAALFVASGGILIETDFAGTPRANTILLVAGAVLANLIGTTGASMLLIRPYLRLNAGRIRPYHVVFFIFIVSNVGGALTPIGDPPLFLGFLRGVPFFWTIEHLWYIWLPAIAFLAAVFYVVDRRNTQKSVREVVPEEWLEDDLLASEADAATTIPGPTRFRIVGGRNALWLAAVIACVFVDPTVIAGVPDLVRDFYLPLGLREILMLGIAYLAYRTADPLALRGNGFTFAPIKEVAWLFVGIFLTMQPALKLIGVFAQHNASVLTIHHFYFGTGILSGVLDNAPTYVSFLAAAMAKFGLSIDSVAQVKEMAAGTVPGALESWHYVQAISIASVFWGALTYIGNGPNFMVKSIADDAGIETPSFFRYVFRYALPVLVPLYLLTWLIFFSGWIINLHRAPL
ncbi:MAG: sodium:proton antiporter [Bacteroidetes bacterium]|nr:sodium:proton antiporter [Bacteroidota bacterium]